MALIQRLLTIIDPLFPGGVGGVLLNSQSPFSAYGEGPMQFFFFVSHGSVKKMAAFGKVTDLFLKGSHFLH